MVDLVPQSGHVLIYAPNGLETNSGIAQACVQFASQITPVLPMDGMAIVLLEPEGDTSRVAYSWENPAVSRPPPWRPAGAASTPLQRTRPSLRISLNGNEGLLGQVLVRGCGPGVYSSSRRALVQEFADRLALVLENIRLVRCLNGMQNVKRAVQQVRQSEESGAPLNRVFRRFAKEIKAMVEFHRLSIYPVSQESDLAICAYRTGQGVGHRRPGESIKLSHSGLVEPAASGESRIFSDLSESGCPVVWNQIMRSKMRSALLVPVLQHGDTVGMVLLEHSLPQAFGNSDQTCLEELVVALTPSLARLEFPKRYNTDSLDEFGAQVPPVVQAGRIHAHAKRHADQLQRLNRLEVSPALPGSLSSLINTLADQAVSIAQAEWSAAFVYDHQALALAPVAGATFRLEESPENLTEDFIEAIAGLAARCLDEGQPVRRSLRRLCKSEVLEDHSAKGPAAGVRERESWKCLAMPLQNSIEKTGVLVLGRSGGIPWTREEVYLLEAFVGEAANEIESARRKDSRRRTYNEISAGRSRPTHLRIA